jgi:DNA ligase-1
MLAQLSTLIDALAATSKRTEKIAILSKAPLEARPYILAAYDPNRVYHVTPAKVAKFKPKAAIVSVYPDALTLLDDLAERRLTGSRALEAICAFESNVVPNHVEVFRRILGKDFKVGINKTTIDAALPGLLPTSMKVSLGRPYEAKFVTNPTEWAVSQKLDGVRCIVHLSEGTAPRFYSRQGKEYHSMGVLAERLGTYTGPDLYLDGEVTLAGKEFTDLMKLVMHGQLGDDALYSVFDILTAEEFTTGDGAPGVTLFDRLSRAHGHPTIEELILPQYDYGRYFTGMVERAAREGWEGLIVRNWKAPYKGRRSNDLLKFKAFHTMELRVTGVTNGVKGGKNTCSSVTVDYGGHDVKVGSGFSDGLRAEIYEDPTIIVGKVIEVQYFEKTEKSLRFPTFICIHGDSRDV